MDLTKAKWELRGYRPNYWRQRGAIEHGGNYQPQWGPMPTKVPGSAQSALGAAGVLPDWNVGTNSLLCEWVEHYEWEFQTPLKAVRLRDGERAILHCDGLDYSGWIGIDGKAVAEFKGALIRHEFDLTEKLADGKAHVLSVVFAQPPAEQGQIGFTSQSRFFKPRYSYSWDWCPRFVPVGIWDAIWVEVGAPAVKVVKVLTSLGDDLKSGTVRVFVENGKDGAQVRAILKKGRGEVAVKEWPLAAGRHELKLEAEVEPWFPNGVGKQPLYQLSVETGDDAIYSATVGFKTIRWLQNPTAPADARPYLCEVNGEPIFLQGVNWTPIRMDYHDVPAEEYEKRIALYKEMGCNVLRVWGGAFLEREVFYDLCDRAGLLVWQEFPLSSSGIDNYAPEDAQAIEDLRIIARDYIRRRGHHACKLLWCGGNELQTLPDQNRQEFPLREDHPALAAMKKIVEEEDPETRFLPTSPSGPVFYATPENVGKNLGIHHHVHGPWNHRGPIEKAAEYWGKDDANFRSETGMPGASSFALIKKYSDGVLAWPASHENPLWQHSAPWWLPGDQFKEELKGLKGEAALKKFCQLSQDFQAEILRLAAGSCKGRFPACSGFIVWMGHDAFPCVCNTSVIDFDGKPKRAYEALGKVFRSSVAPSS